MSKMKLKNALFNLTRLTVDLDYVVYGKKSSSKQPIVVLHGFLSSKASSEGICESLNEITGRVVYNIDARNHGKSPHAPTNTYFDMMCDTVKLVQALDLRNVTLLGQSLGGRTAMMMSLFYPELVSNQIVVDISPASKSQQLGNSFPKVLDAINKIHFKNLISIEEAKLYAVNELQAYGITQKKVVEFVLKNVGVKADGTVGWLPNVSVLRDYFDILEYFPYIPGKSNEIPTLFLKAEHSDFLPLEDLPAIRSYFPRAEITTIADVGHNIQEENPEALIKLVSEFLKKNP